MPRGINPRDEAQLQRQLWTPSLVPNLELWLDAADFSSLDNGSSISQWNDKSGKNRHATQASGPNCPTVKSHWNNGLPILFFNFWNEMETTIPAGTFSSHFHFYTVIQMPEQAGANITIPVTRTYINLAKPFDGFVSDSGTILLCGDSGNVRNGATTRNELSKKCIYAVLLSALPSTYEILNGHIKAEYQETWSPYNDTTTTVSIGARGDLGTLFYGYIAEVLVFSAPANRFVIEGYLAWKWGLVTNLPGAHPFSNSPPLRGS